MFMVTDQRSPSGISYICFGGTGQVTTTAQALTHLGYPSLELWTVVYPQFIFKLTSKKCSVVAKDIIAVYFK